MAYNDDRNHSSLVAQNFPRLDYLRTDTNVQAIVDKLIEDRRGMHSTTGRNRSIHGIAGDYMLEKLSDQASTNATDANSIMELLPDMELVRQILVSSIISPKDMVSSEINYRCNHPSLGGELSSAMLSIIEEYFDKTYKIKNILSKALSDALFMRGAYPLVILPENSIDYAINSADRVGLEAVSEEIDPTTKKPVPVGLLGAGLEGQSESKSQRADFEKGISLESFFDPSMDQIRPQHHYTDINKRLGFEVVDNPNVLKFPVFFDKVNQDRVHDRLQNHTLGIEADLMGDGQIGEAKRLEASLYQRRNYRNVPIMPIRTAAEAEGKPRGHPLVMNVPSEAIIPVHVPSTPEQHVGFLMLLDEMGNPVDRADESKYYNELSQNLKGESDMSSYLVQNAHLNTYGRQESESEVDEKELIRFYGEIVEKDLVARLKNGVYGNNIEIRAPDNIYRIMFARACANMMTQILYVPAELVTYIAFDYNKHGMGRSLIDRTKVLAGIRATLLFANTMGGIKNSIGKVRMNIELDENDPDPSGTVEFLRHEYARTRQAQYPIGASNPIDIIDFLQDAAIDLQVSGNSAYPDTQVDIESNHQDRAPVEDELEESIRNRHIMGLGLNPEMVDQSMDVDFATTIASQNVLFSKRTKIYQERYEEFLADFHRKYTLNSGTLMESLRGVVENNRDNLPDESKKLTSDQIIMSFLESLSVELPSPDTTTLENQLESFENYKRGLDEALEAYISPDFLTDMDLGDEAEALVDPMMFAVKAHYMRQWMRDNNMLTELDEMITLDEDGNKSFDLLERHGAFVEALGSAIEPYLKKRIAKNTSRDTRLDVHREEAETMSEQDAETERQRIEAERKRREEEQTIEAAEAGEDFDPNESSSGGEDTDAGGDEEVGEDETAGDEEEEAPDETGDEEEEEATEEEEETGEEEDEKDEAGTESRSEELPWWLQET